MKSIIKSGILLLTLSLLTISCGDAGESTQTSGSVNSEAITLAENGQYVQALQSTQQIQATKPEEAVATFSEIEKMLRADLEAIHSDKATDSAKIAAHYNYGIYLEYYANSIEMKTRMTDALKNFRRVLELDPENTQAQAEIEQIEAIYRSMGRDVPTGVAK